MTLVSRKPRQIVGFDVARDKSPKRIQAIIDSAPEAKNYFSDGWNGYRDVVYPGNFTQNVHNKDDTFTVEGVNADLRHYIPILARRVGALQGSLRRCVWLLLYLLKHTTLLEQQKCVGNACTKRAKYHFSCSISCKDAFVHSRGNTSI